MPLEIRDGSVPAGVGRMIQKRRYATTYDATFGSIGLFRYDHQMLMRWFACPGRLLDLGCGTGRTLVAFARRGFAVEGVDLSSEMLEVARRKLQEVGVEDAPLYQGNIADLPMEALRPPYDYAVCLFSTLGLVAGHANRVRAVRQAASLLRPGGQYVFHAQNLLYNLPTLHLPWILTGLATAVVGRGEVGDQVLWWYWGGPWIRVHAFRPAEVRRLVREAGLELVEIVYLNKTCDGPLEAATWRRWRANGFLVRARRPEETPE